MSKKQIEIGESLKPHTTVSDNGQPLPLEKPKTATVSTKDLPKSMPHPVEYPVEFPKYPADSEGPKTVPAHIVMLEDLKKDMEELSNRVAKLEKENKKLKKKIKRETVDITTVNPKYEYEANHIDEVIHIPITSKRGICPRCGSEWNLEEEGKELGKGCRSCKKSVRYYLKKKEDTK